MKTNSDLPRVGIVGPCTSGKSTLIHNLSGQNHTFNLRHIAQEHSYVQTMWQVISKPRWLIYLDVSYAESLRRKNLNWTENEYLEQVRRLQHARDHADFYIHTDGMNPEQVAEKVKEFLGTLGIEQEPPEKPGG